MNEPTSAGASRRMPWGLLGMLGLMLVIEAFIARYDDELSTNFLSNWNLKARSAETKARDADVLFFGDSQVLQGLVPRVVEEQMDLRAYNLAVIGVQSPGTYSLFRRALAAGAKPKRVVVNFVPHLLSVGPRENLRNWPALLGCGENLQLAWESRDSTFLAETIVMRTLPSYRNRWALRHYPRALVRGRAGAMRRDVLAHRRNWIANAGAELNPRTTGRTGDPSNIANLLYPTEGWSCDPVNALYIERFLNLAEAHGVPVCWLIPPLAPQPTARRMEMGLETIQTAFIQSFRKRHPTLTVLDGRAKGYEESVFIDSVHLDKQGAMAWSRAVGDALRDLTESRDSPQSRWVELPRYRDPTEEAPFEDMDQSRLALQVATGTPRR